MNKKSLFKLEQLRAYLVTKKYVGSETFTEQDEKTLKIATELSRKEDMREYKMPIIPMSILRNEGESDIEFTNRIKKKYKIKL